ncbi:MAG: sugar ABC transporter substrate-binding protein [Acidobacteria bacterium]|nr:MAG: sugar ABC transporter substrate-binding protein [Acidobacteriota bacterium]
MHTTIRNLWMTLIAGFALLVLMGCQRGNNPSADKPTVALVLKTLNNPFFMDMQKGAQEAAQKFGVRLLVQAAERELDVEKQMQIIETLIQAKVSALCVTPSGSKEIVPAIVKANRAAIPVLIVDTRVDSQTLREAGGKVEAFIGSDNFAGGRLAGEYLAKRLGQKGKAAILEGIPGHETGDSRLRGFKQALANYPDVQIVSSQTANWERDQGYNVFQNVLESHPDVQALFACSDLMALGAIEAIGAAGKTGKITVVGFDALPEAREAIQKGRMDATIAQFPIQMGAIAVENACRLLKGETVPRDISVKIQLVTRENAGSYLVSIH